MGISNCCCVTDENLKKESSSEMLNLGILKPKQGKKYQLLCLRGHEIIFYKKVKENYEHYSST